MQKPRCGGGKDLAFPSKIRDRKGKEAPSKDYAFNKEGKGKQMTFLCFYLFFRSNHPPCLQDLSEYLKKKKSSGRFHTVKCICCRAEPTHFGSMWLVNALMQRKKHGRDLGMQPDLPRRDGLQMVLLTSGK